MSSREAFEVLLDWPSTNLVNEESNGCDKGRVRVLSRSCHLCECGEKGDAVGAVHFTQPGLKPLLVLWVWKWDTCSYGFRNITLTFAKRLSNQLYKLNRYNAMRHC